MVPWAALDFDGWWNGLSPRERYILASMSLVAVLLLGALVLLIVHRWRRNTDSDSDSSRGREQMSTFRELYEKGMLSREEYDRIRNKLSIRMLGKPEKPAPAAEPGKPPTPASEPPSQEKPPT